jgi:hypothetical protein
MWFLFAQMQVPEDRETWYEWIQFSVWQRVYQGMGINEGVPGQIITVILLIGASLLVVRIGWKWLVGMADAGSAGADGRTVRMGKPGADDAMRRRRERQVDRELERESYRDY